MADQPIAHWTRPPYADVDATYHLGMVAFDRTQVALVRFAVSALGFVLDVPTVAQNPTTGTWEYFITLPDGAIPTAAYTVVGTAVSTAGKFRALSLPINVFSGSATYTTFWVDADSGSDAGAGTEGDPFQSLDAGLEALAGVGDGGRVYLKEASSGYTFLGNVTVPVTTARYVNIEAAPGAAKANVRITSFLGAIGSSKVRFKGLTFRVPVLGTAGATLWLDNCHLQGSSSTTSIGASGWTPTWSAVYFTDGEVSACLESLEAVKLARGATISSIGGDGWRGATGSALIDSTLSTVAGHGLRFQAQGNVDNALCFNVSALNVTGAGLEMHPAALRQYTNCALVNVLTESATTNQIRDIAPDHLLIWNCGFNTARFTWACALPVRLSVRQSVFVRMTAGAGDLVAVPDMDLVDGSFADCHYIDGPTGAGLFLGSNPTEGSAGYTNEAADDYTPAAGSDLYDQHTVSLLVRCDQEKVARADPTTVGPLRGADEGGGSGDAPPSGLTYTPALTDAQVGVAITDIEPDYSGAVSLFEVAPSVYHIYKPLPEVPCDAANAHFEVRPWQAGDPLHSGTKYAGTGGQPPFVVEDLRDDSDGAGGHAVYAQHPKLFANSSFGAIAFALNLCGPYANEVAGVHLPGPWPAERPIVRVRGNAAYIGSSIIIEGTLALGNNKSHDHTGGDGGGSIQVAWAGVPGIGGFYPISGGTFAEGKGMRITASVVGATGGMADRIQGAGLAEGYVKADGTKDATYGVDDILFKDFTFVNNPFSHHGECFNGGYTNRFGRLRLYDYQFEQLAKSDGTYAFSGFGVRHCIRINAAGHYDFRRGTYPHAWEHANYVDLINGGLHRDAVGKQRDSCFIDLRLPHGTGRSMIQMVDRPYDMQTAGFISGVPPTVPPTPATKTMPGGTGTVLIERCFIGAGGTDGTSWYTAVGGPALTFIFRSNRIEQKGPIGQTTLLPAGNPVVLSHHKRGIIVFPWAEGASATFVVDPEFKAQAIRVGPTGYGVGTVAVIDHFDHTDNGSEKHMSFRGCESVNIYSFEHLATLGSTSRTDIGLDEVDQDAPGPPWYGVAAPEQFNLDGALVYSTQGGFGTPLSNTGHFNPHNGAVHLYMGYPAQPATWGGWVQSSNKVWSATHPASSFTNLTTGQINALAGVPVFLPAGLSLNASTGVVSGTPTEEMGIDFLTLGKLGTPIDSPGAYLTSGASAGYVRIPIRASNPSSADAWTPGEFHLHITDSGPGGTLIVHPPAIEVEVTVPTDGIDVAVDCLVDPPAIEVEITVPTGGTNSSPGLQVDQTGLIQKVRPPHIEVEVSIGAPAITNTVEVAPPPILVEFTVPTEGIAITGASNAHDGPGAAIGLRAGFEAGIGI